MKNDRKLTPGQIKKALAAITSMLGNIRIYFPKMEEDFLKTLEAQYSELYELAVDKGIIQKITLMPAGKSAASIPNGLRERSRSILFV